jgi:hypothetical protein
MMEELIKKDARIKYHRHSENIGMMANYKYALDRVNTSYFSFLSDDDFLLPCFYEEALKGFQEFPDAALSACGIWQLDDQGNFAGDPLARWESEGYYSVPKGLLEMIKTRHRFPIPTGILFQNSLVKDIKPNFCDEIHFFWDPDYLLRIACKHPFVINKKTCGIYLAHAGCFSNSFYIKLLSCGENFDHYLTGVKKTMNGLEKNHLRSSVQGRAKSYFRKYIEEDVIDFIKNYIKTSKFDDAKILAKKYSSYFGFSAKITFLYSIAILPRFSTSLIKINEKISAIKIKFFPKKIKLDPINMDELKKNHTYGQDLYR